MSALLLGVQLPTQSSPRAGDRIPTSQGDLVIYPINHASLVLTWNNLTIIVDPVGDPQRYEGFQRPDLVLLTDIHQDHLNNKTLASLNGKALVVAPAVAKQLPEFSARTTVRSNGQSATVAGVKIEAIAAYNVTPDRLRFHEKGRGNGYLFTFGDKRVYLSGDTEPTPEMRALKNIDVAFLCMNLPYTMDVEQAAGVVREFRPKIVYPYHCRGSDLEKFKKLVGTESGVEVRIRDWYK